MNPNSTVTAPYPHPDGYPTVTVAEYARLAGLSARTIREKVRRGQLSAELVKGPHGFEYRLPHPDSHPTITVEAPYRNGSAHPDSTVPDLTLAAMIELVDRVTRENTELAGRVGWLQAENQRLLLLTAPAVDVDSAPLANSSGSAPQPLSEHPRSWWRRLLMG